MEKLRQLAALPDRELWDEARRMAAGYGFSLKEDVPSHAELEQLRGLVLGQDRIRMSEALKILNCYTKKGGQR